MIYGFFYFTRKVNITPLSIAVAVVVRYNLKIVQTRKEIQKNALPCALLCLFFTGNTSWYDKFYPMDSIRYFSYYKKK